MRATCAGCPDLGQDKIINTPIFYCVRTTYVVPQQFGNGVATFWRVPMSCPRNDTLKSEEKAPAEQWVTIEVVGGNEVKA